MNAPVTLKTAVARLKRLAIHEIESSKTGSIFILNNTMPRGALNMTIADGMGGQTSVRVPIAKIPVDLATQATKRNIVSSPQVRTLHAKRVIEFIDEDQARELLNTHPDARAEHARLYAVGEISAIGDADEQAGEVAQVQQEASGDLNPFAVEMAFDENLSEEDLIMTLRGREDELTEADLLYIVSNSKHDRVKAWAAEKANELKAG